MLVGEDILRETLKSATTDVFARLRAVNELAKSGSPAGIQTIVDAMATERTSWRRRAIARGELRPDPVPAAFSETLFFFLRGPG